VARSERATRLYVRGARPSPGTRLGTLLEGAVMGQGIPWKPLSFPARDVVLGERTTVRMHPHLGEFDQAALFRRRLGYEQPVFAWLERHAAQRYEAVVEIGANVGIYSFFFDALIKSAPEGRLHQVYAFEPSDQAYLPAAGKPGSVLGTFRLPHLMRLSPTGPGSPRSSSRRATSRTARCANRSRSSSLRPAPAWS
jgi:hypothetical protein